MLIRREEVLEIDLGPKYKFKVGDLVKHSDPYYGKEVGEVRSRQKRQVSYTHRGVTNRYTQYVYDVMFRHHVTTLPEETIIKV